MILADPFCDADEEAVGDGLDGDQREAGSDGRGRPPAAVVVGAAAAPRPPVALPGCGSICARRRRQRVRADGSGPGAANLRSDTSTSSGVNWQEIPDGAARAHRPLRRLQARLGYMEFDRMSTIHASAA